MADVWATTDWAHRHFAEGLGFWEVNVYKALHHWHRDYKTLGHGNFRKRLAHACLTLGKVTWDGDSPAAPTGVLGSKMAKTGRQLRFATHKRLELIRGVGSPDLGIVLLFALECSPPQPQIEQGNGRFRFFARRSQFSKGALRAVGAVAWAAASGGTKSCAPRWCTAKLLVTARCAVQAFFICCGCGSSAASSRAVQLEQPKASKREREQESRGSKSIARSSRSLQDTFAVDFCSPPRFL